MSETSLSDILMNEDGKMQFELVFSNFNQIRKLLAESDSKQFNEIETRYKQHISTAESESDYNKKIELYRELIALYKRALELINKNPTSS